MAMLTVPPMTSAKGRAELAASRGLEAWEARGSSCSCRSCPA
eukprot:CAMPEP_0172623688 /NCGR_PEP_ID=MMETSP1068-20121228/130914_1 /TAXON_ID=35684 /ORGANISM="Pseudopedinella elastica, Strain CCMP716" /LENGTH=41 /DNA_ID= /DNA_START= /DNA_END= /DNA_ORIENTATION=